MKLQKKNSDLFRDGKKGGELETKTAKNLIKPNILTHIQIYIHIYIVQTAKMRIIRTGQFNTVGSILVNEDNKIPRVTLHYVLLKTKATLTNTEPLQRAP